MATATAVAVAVRGEPRKQRRQDDRAETRMGRATDTGGNEQRGRREEQRGEQGKRSKQRRIQHHQQISHDQQVLEYKHSVQNPHETRTGATTRGGDSTAMDRIGGDHVSKRNKGTCAQSLKPEHLRCFASAPFSSSTVGKVKLEPKWLRSCCCCLGHDLMCVYGHSTPVTATQSLRLLGGRSPGSRDSRRPRHLPSPRRRRTLHRRGLQKTQLAQTSDSWESLQIQGASRRNCPNFHMKLFSNRSIYCAYFSSSEGEQDEE